MVERQWTGSTIARDLGGWRDKEETYDHDFVLYLFTGLIDRYTDRTKLNKNKLNRNINFSFRGSVIYF